MRTASLAAAAGLCVLLAGVLLAQDQAPARPQTPIFRGGASFVRVDLYATKDGRPVEDLQQAEVEVFEDNVRQTVQTFEHVRVAPPVAQELRAEPNTVEQSRQMAADPRARIFVIFLDTYHTQIDGSARMRGPLLQFIDRVVGQDDFIALMTPEMSAADVTLGRRTTVISKLLNDNTMWGRRGRLVDDDPIEQQYDACYGGDDQSIATEMKARRREKLTLDALDDLVVHLGGLREERKAVLAVTEGWLEFGPNPQLARLLKRDEGRIPDVPGIVSRGVARQGDRSTLGSGREKCEADRVALANMDNTTRLIEIGGRANRVNVSFYPVGAQGLAVFDSPIGPDPPLPLAQDSANLRTRQNGLRLLAEQTDGVAIVNTNNVNSLLQRVVDDLSSYYLLGYTSTNSKPDGKLRSITVRVARPGLQTRARKGYRALTVAEMSAATPVSTAPAAPTAVMRALEAMGLLSARTELKLRTSSWLAPAAGSGRGASVWVVGTLEDAVRRDPAWAGGGNADVSVRASDGRTVLSKAVPLVSADGSFALAAPEGDPLPPGEYTVRVRLRPAGSGAPIDEQARVLIAADAPALGEAVAWRRRPVTGLQYFRTALPRVARADRLRLEFATASTATAVASLLDRQGAPLAVPVQVSAREETPGGQRWVVVDISVAALAPGDYAVEVTQESAKQVSAFRVVP